MSTVTLADIESFDSRPITSGGRNRYLCMWCGSSKPSDTSHKCLSVNVEEGVYFCHRCRSKGRLDGYGTQNECTPEERAERQQKKQEEMAERMRKLRYILSASVPLSHSADGSNYLLDRGIPNEDAAACNVLAYTNKAGRVAVVFTMVNVNGSIVAAQRRYIDGAEPKILTCGLPQEGLFLSRLARGGNNKKFLAIVEAPIDAISLDLLGQPAVACCGSSMSSIIPDFMKKNGYLGAYIASDNDGPGDKAAQLWADRVQIAGFKTARLRPQGVKDWNDYIQTQSGRARVQATLRRT